MPDHILRIPLSDRAEVLQSIAPRAGLPPYVLEKDIWVCWALAAVFEMPDQLPLAFKGGTALSKVYQAIGRFSEDIDLTIDYTALSGADPLTQDMSGNAIKKLSEQLRAAVDAHTREVITPYLTRLGQERLGTSLAIEVSEDGEGVRIRYPSAFGGDPSYLRDQDSVLLEFGGRNTTLPNERHRVVSYAAAHTEKLEFPVAEVIVLSPHRSFWEKATLIHAECHRPERPSGAFGAERLSRHWYDLARLARQEIGLAALRDRELLMHVVRLKGIFYRSGFANYPACLEGKFCLVPDEPLRAALERDFSAMVSEGMFFEPPSSFATILEELRALETTLNRA